MLGGMRTMERLGTMQGAVIIKEKTGLIAFGWNPNDQTTAIKANMKSAVSVFYQRDDTNPNAPFCLQVVIGSYFQGKPHTIVLHDRQKVVLDIDLARLVWDTLMSKKKSDTLPMWLRLGTGPLAPDNVEFEA